MSRGGTDLLEASQLAALWRGVCLYAGLPLPPAASSRERFVVRSGTEPPELLARLLREGFVEDGVEVVVGLAEPEAGGVASARVVVRFGHAAPCPDADELRQAVATGGPVMLFAVERHDEAGRLLGVTWVAVPEEEPPPQGRFRAAIRSHEYDPPQTVAEVPAT